MSSEGDYIIGETKHLIENGMNPLDVCKALNRKPNSIASLLARRNETQLARLFYNLKTKTER